MKKAIGIDIGGTEIKAAIVSEDGGVCGVVKCPTAAKSGLAGITDSLKWVTNEVCSNCGEVLGVGVASAGNIDFKSGRVVYATENLPQYTGFELAAFVENVSKKRVKVDNDAYLALFGELKFGAAQGYKNAAMITIGTGVGGAAVVNGEIYHGNSFSAARFGHLTLVPNGKKCTCGRLGCSEQYLSGTAFTNGVRGLGYNILHGSEAFELLAGNAAIETFLIEFMNNLKILCTDIVNTFDPEIIVIGGGFINSWEHWWDKYFIPITSGLGVKFARAELGNMAGIIGAAALFFNEEGGHR